MPSDVPSLRYVMPKFPRGYNLVMKTLRNSLRFELSDHAKFRLHVLEHGKKYGVKSAVAAFKIGRSTYYDWLTALNSSKGKLVSLVPLSTRPKQTRQMVVDSRLLEFIKSVREQYGRIGKDKLKILVDSYALSLGIDGYGSTKIGKIIKRHKYFFDPPKRIKKVNLVKNRVKRVAKNIKPGYLEVDSIIVYVGSVKLRFVSVVDVVTKLAHVDRVSSGQASNTIRVLENFIKKHNLKIHTIQTDNGSEFLGDFHLYLEEQQIDHKFIYPRSPKINGVVERFNRTVQEEFIERCDEFWFDLNQGDKKLEAYLCWYNETRPHASLNYMAPLVYAKQYQYK